MTRVRDRHSAASIRARLLERAKRDHEEFQRVLVRYANERVLYRLSKSVHRDDFVLKGASLFAVWQQDLPRATKDVDLLGTGTPSPSRLKALTLGLANSRMKDYFDIAFLASHFSFEGPVLARAFEATFLRRETSLPTELPIALTDQFALDAQKRVQWASFARRVRHDARQDLAAVVAIARAFVWPATKAAAAKTTFLATWTGGRWEGLDPSTSTALVFAK